jgi:hypothetical protein
MSLLFPELLKEEVRILILANKLYCEIKFLATISVMTKDKDITESIDQYFCENCGFTSAVENEHCPECSGKMIGLEDSEDMDDMDEEGSLNQDGSESLESLASSEYEEDDADYNQRVTKYDEDE